MAELAGDELTRGAIYLFESGRARPSRESLELIAETTGKPVSSFLAESGDLKVERAAALIMIERAVRDGDYVRAIAAGEDLEARGLEPPDLVIVELRLAESDLMLGRPDKAIKRIRAALDALSRLPAQPELRVECELLHGRILGALGDPSAHGVLDTALQLCRALSAPRNDLEARLQMLRADLHARDGRWDAALASAKAAEALVGLGDLLQGSVAAHDATARRDDTAGAKVEALIHQARALELSTWRETVELATAAHLKQATFLIRREDFEPATELLGEVLLLARLVGDTHAETEASLKLAHVHFALGDISRASAAAGLVLASGDGIQRAGAQLLRGKVAAASGAPARQVDAAFRDAITAFADLGAVEELAAAHVAFAEVLEARGQVRAALAQWKLAATAMRPGLGSGLAAPQRPAVQGA